MKYVSSPARKRGQVAPRWCTTNQVDTIALLTLADITGDAEWRARADDELIRLPAPHRRRLLASYTHPRRGAL